MPAEPVNSLIQTSATASVIPPENKSGDVDGASQPLGDELSQSKIESQQQIDAQLPLKPSPPNENGQTIPGGQQPPVNERGDKADPEPTETDANMSDTPPSGNWSLMDYVPSVETGIGSLQAYAVSVAAYVSENAPYAGQKLSAGATQAVSFVMENAPGVGASILNGATYTAETARPILATAREYVSNGVEDMMALAIDISRRGVETEVSQALITLREWTRTINDIGGLMESAQSLRSTAGSGVADEISKAQEAVAKVRADAKEIKVAQSAFKLLSKYGENREPLQFGLQDLQELRTLMNDFLVHLKGHGANWVDVRGEVTAVANRMNENLQWEGHRALPACLQAIDLQLERTGLTRSHAPSTLEPPEVRVINKRSYSTDFDNKIALSLKGDGMPVFAELGPLMFWAEFFQEEIFAGKSSVEVIVKREA